MDDRGRCLDNIFIERPWRSLKYEAVHLRELPDDRAAEREIGDWFDFTTCCVRIRLSTGVRRATSTGTNGEKPREAPTRRCGLALWSLRSLRARPEGNISALEKRGHFYFALTHASPSVDSIPHQA